jgi:hypothetical protein
MRITCTLASVFALSGQLCAVGSVPEPVHVQGAVPELAPSAPDPQLSLHGGAGAARVPDNTVEGLHFNRSASGVTLRVRP